MENNKTMEKLEKELFDEYRKKKIAEIESYLQESKNEAILINESINSVEEFLKYFEQCTPWEEFRKEWLK